MSLFCFFSGVKTNSPKFSRRLHFLWSMVCRVQASRAYHLRENVQQWKALEESLLTLTDCKSNLGKPQMLGSVWYLFKEYIGVKLHVSSKRCATSRCISYEQCLIRVVCGCLYLLQERTGLLSVSIQSVSIFLFKCGGLSGC